MYQFYRRFQLWQGGKLSIGELESLRPEIIEEIPIEELKGKKVLVVTSCTAEKLGSTPKVRAKAKDMYQGRMFKLVRRLCERMGWDYVIISAKYGLVFPDEEIEGYEKFLRTKQDREIIKQKVLLRLSELLPTYERFLVIAGLNYRKVIHILMDKRFLVLHAKGYGDLCSRVKHGILKTDTKLLDFMN